MSAKTQTNIKPKCGLIMPIAQGDGYTQQHWKKLKDLLESYIKQCNFEPNLVSNETIITPIHKNIVQNIFDYPIVVCDVSSRNPNVLFELGLRFAFGKPAILLKDNTDERYIFDINLIPQIRYPRSLANSKSLFEFKKEFTTSLKNTYNHYQKNLSDSQFLKLFEIPNPSFAKQKDIQEDREEIDDRGIFFQKAIDLLLTTKSFRCTFLGPIFLHPQWLVNRRNKKTQRPNFDNTLLKFIKFNSGKYSGQISIILRNTQRYQDKLDELIKPAERTKFKKDMIMAIDDMFGIDGRNGIDICCHNPGHFKIDLMYDNQYLEGSRKSETNQITGGYMYSGKDQLKNAKKEFDSVFDIHFSTRQNEVLKLKSFINNLWL